jgi:type IV fimbrial biogenesis protein FimT
VRRGQRGFNLIEVIVTMSVLAMVIGVMVPSAADWIHNTHVRSLAESLQNGLQKARAEALRRNTVVTFWLVAPSAAAPLDGTCAVSASSASWVISMDDPSGKCDVGPSQTAAPRIIEKFAAGSGASGVTVAGLAGDATTAASAVSFNGYGQAVKTGSPLARIDISHSQGGARRLAVKITSGGGVRMCDRDVGSTDPRSCG